MAVWDLKRMHGQTTKFCTSNDSASLFTHKTYKSLKTLPPKLHTAKYRGKILRLSLGASQLVIDRI